MGLFNSCFLIALQCVVFLGHLGRLLAHVRSCASYVGGKLGTIPPGLLCVQTVPQGAPCNATIRSPCPISVFAWDVNIIWSLDREPVPRSEQTILLDKCIRSYLAVDLACHSAGSACLALSRLALERLAWKSWHTSATSAFPATPAKICATSQPGCAMRVGPLPAAESTQAQRW